MKLIIQIPCLNEAQTLEIALNDLPRQIEGIDSIEYLIINDGSSDNTVEVAKKWGVHYVVSFPRNRGLARGFMAGLDACLKNGADIIVNTDADNQYCGEDIARLVEPILRGEAEVVIGERPIDETAHFSPLKKKLQHLGSYVVRKASATDIPDAPSGFRAFSRDAAMRINVVNDYTYTLETILRAYMMYKPLKTFSYLAVSPILTGLLIGFRFLYYMARGQSGGHVQSLILACTLIIMGFLTFMIGLLADVIAANRKLLQDTQYHARRMEYDAIYMQMKAEKEAVRTYRLINGEEAAPPAKAKER